MDDTERKSIELKAKLEVWEQVSNGIEDDEQKTQAMENLIELYGQYVALLETKLEGNAYRDRQAEELLKSAGYVKSARGWHPPITNESGIIDE